MDFCTFPDVQQLDYRYNFCYNLIIAKGDM